MQNEASLEEPVDSQLQEVGDEYLNAESIHSESHRFNSTEGTYTKKVMEDLGRPSFCLFWKFLVKI